MRKIHVTIDVDRLAKMLEGRVVSVRTLTEMLPVSPRTAGRIIAKLRRMGMLEPVAGSNRRFRVVRRAY